MFCPEICYFISFHCTNNSNTSFFSLRPLIESGKNPGKYIRYTPEDLDRMLGEFFDGRTEQKR